MFRVTFYKCTDCSSPELSARDFISLLIIQSGKPRKTIIIVTVVVIKKPLTQSSGLHLKLIHQLLTAILELQISFLGLTLTLHLFCLASEYPFSFTSSNYHAISLLPSTIKFVDKVVSPLFIPLY